MRERLKEGMNERTIERRKGQGKQYKNVRDKRTKDTRRSILDKRKRLTYGKK